MRCKATPDNRRRSASRPSMEWTRKAKLRPRRPPKIRRTVRVVGRPSDASNRPVDNLDTRFHVRPKYHRSSPDIAPRRSEPRDMPGSGSGRRREAHFNDTAAAGCTPAPASRPRRLHSSGGSLQRPSALLRSRTRICTANPHLARAIANTERTECSSVSVTSDVAAGILSAGELGFQPRGLGSRDAASLAGRMPVATGFQQLADARNWACVS